MRGQPELNAADRVVVGYNLIFAAVWLIASTGYSAGLLLAGMHVSLGALPLIASRIDPTHSRAAAVIRDVYPLFLVVLFWSEMGLVRQELHSAGNDAHIVALELQMTATSPHQVLAQTVSWAWFAELMSAMYTLYYPMVFLTPVVVALRGRRAAARDIVYTLTVAYCACYLSYLLFPVDGPRRFLGTVASAGTDSWVYGFVSMLVHAGDSIGTAFPSSHVVGAVTMALLARRWFSRQTALLFQLEAAGVMASTVYCQHHYLTDMIAGFGVALFVFFVAAPTLKRSLSGVSRSHQHLLRPPSKRPYSVSEAKT